MGFSIFTQGIWIYYLANISKEQEKGEAQCQIIHYVTFFAATTCSNWRRRLEATPCQPLLQSVSATISQSSQLSILTHLCHFVHQALSKIYE